MLRSDRAEAASAEVFLPTVPEVARDLGTPELPKGTVFKPVWPDLGDLDAFRGRGRGSTTFPAMAGLYTLGMSLG